MSKNRTVIVGYGVKLLKEDFDFFLERNPNLENELTDHKINIMKINFEDVFLFPEPYSKSLINFEGFIDIESIRKPVDEFMNEPYLLNLLRYIKFDFGFYTVFETN